MLDGPLQGLDNGRRWPSVAASAPDITMVADGADLSVLALCPAGAPRAGKHSCSSSLARGGRRCSGRAAWLGHPGAGARASRRRPRHPARRMRGGDHRGCRQWRRPVARTRMAQSRSRQRDHRTTGRLPPASPITRRSAGRTTGCERHRIITTGSTSRGRARRRGGSLARLPLLLHPSAPSSPIATAIAGATFRAASRGDRPAHRTGRDLSVFHRRDLPAAGQCCSRR